MVAKMFITYCVLFIWVLITIPSHGCLQREPLGIANGRIPSSNLTASSSFGIKWGPSQARLNTASSWCSGINGTWQNDWIQVDFGNAVNITGIAIQGNYDNSADKVLGFYLQFSEDGVLFKNHTDSAGNLMEQESPLSSRNGVQYFWFTAVSTRRLRIKATKLFLTGSMARFCIRFEVFGCMYGKHDKSLYSVGLENHIIPDAQLTSSAYLAGQPPYHARLNIPNSWCVPAQTNQWLQIDFGLVLAVNAITTQGDHGRNSKNLVSRFMVSYSRDSKTSFVFIKSGLQNKTFIANNQTTEDPVFNYIHPNILAKYVRIHPVSGSPNADKFCLRAEVYVSHPECSVDLTSTNDTSFASVVSGRVTKINYNIDIYSPKSWCASYTSTSELLQIDFGIIRLVSGIAIAGNSELDSWVMSFAAKSGLHVSGMQTLEQRFKGTNGRTETAVNWLKKPRMMRVLQIIPERFVGNKCLRIRVIGCKEIPMMGTPPVLTEALPTTNGVSVGIKKSNQTSRELSAVIIEYVCINGARPCSTSKNIQKIVLNYTDGQSIRISGLLSWTKYEMTSRFLFNSSWTNKSNTIFVTTLPTAPKLAPTGCKVSKIGTSLIFVSWHSLPTNYIDGHIISYNISYYSKVLRNAVSVIRVNSTANNYTIGNLTPNTAYVIMISAMTKGGSGPFCQNETRTLVQGVATSKGFLRNSELALMIITGGVMFIVLFLILLKVCIAKHKVSRRRTKYKKYMKSIQFLALIESTKKGKKSEPVVTLDQEKHVSQRGNDGYVRLGRVLPQPPPVVRIDQTTNTENENENCFGENNIDTPRTLRRKMGVGNGSFIDDVETRDQFLK